MNQTKIKICGLTCDRDVEIVNTARPDFCGFVIDVPQSERNVTVEQAARLAAGLSGVTAVGVFVDADPGLIRRAIELGAAKAVQLHGNESAEDIIDLKAKTGVPIIKAFVVCDAEDVTRAEQSPADLILLDSGRGSGKPFDWTQLKGLRRPYFLAGGLNPDNLPQVLNQLHPWGVDLSSGVEAGTKQPGIQNKDRGKVLAAVAEVRSACLRSNTAVGPAAKDRRKLRMEW